MVNRRKNPRTCVSFPVECKLLPEQRYFYTVSKDVSLSGLKIITNKFMPRDQIFKLNINLVDSIVSLKAKVRWCNKKRVSDRYSTGLEFVESTERQVHKLSHFIHSTHQSS